ncbi:MAG: imidazole glycerol phosphate synthase subunit HisH [Microbacteriaceae bacterium]|nr:imidazole glycerol phosphate synthase subunit HisH [Microbacteriaceae bacterium]
MTKSLPKVVVFDYGSGNVHSAFKALVAAGADVTLTSDQDQALAADGLLIPGVGAFKSVMDALNTKNAGRIIEKRLIASKPVLGICVGMQVFFDTGLEGGEEIPGFGQWPGQVRALKADVLPNIGWSSLEIAENSVLFDGIEEELFYFVHSYAATELPLTGSEAIKPPKLTYATHGERFIAAVENGPLSATQFHPEKSGEAGIKLLTNWIQTF